MPSQPTKLPAFSSMPPIPCWLGSRFADAAFIASMADSLSCTPDDFHGSLPVTFPMVSSAAPLTYHGCQYLSRAVYGLGYLRIERGWRRGRGGSVGQTYCCVEVCECLRFGGYVMRRPLRGVCRY
jgi:hypothetical protein